MFKNAKASTTGLPVVAFEMSNLNEGTITSINIENTTGLDLVLKILIGTVEINIPVGPGLSEYTNKLSVPTNTVVSVLGAEGVNLAFQYTELPIDASAALTAAQQTIASLPEGSVSTGAASEQSTWASTRIVEEIEISSAKVRDQILMHSILF